MIQKLLACRKEATFQTRSSSISFLDEDISSLMKARCESYTKIAGVEE
jgi:hypothetical protein